MIFICFLALILFGPKKLPEIGRQVGKILAEFKRASNDFKYQLQSEIEKSEKDANPNPPVPNATTLAEAASGAPIAPPAAPLVAPANTSFMQSLLPPSVKEAIGSIDTAHDRLMQTAKLAFEAQNFTLRPPAAPVVATAEPTAASAPEAASPANQAAAPDQSLAADQTHAAPAQAAAQPQPAASPADSGPAQPS